MREIFELCCWNIVGEAELVRGIKIEERKEETNHISLLNKKEIRKNIATELVRTSSSAG